jgi:hypothetical protein
MAGSSAGLLFAQPSAMRAPVVLLPCLLLGCGYAPNDGTILTSPELLAPGGERQPGGAPVPEGGPEPGQACPWNAEWFQVWSEQVDHRFLSVRPGPDGSVRIPAAAEHPDKGWFELAVEASGQTEVVFHDESTFRAAPVTTVLPDRLLLAGTRNAEHLAVQARHLSGELIWETDLRRTDDPESWRRTLSARQVLVHPAGITVVGTVDSDSCCQPTVMAAGLGHDGDQRWMRTYPDPIEGEKDEAYEYPFQALPMDDGASLVGAIDFQAGSFDLWLMALDSRGDVLWQRQHGDFERGPSLHLEPWSNAPERRWVAVGSQDVPGSSGGALRVLLLDSTGGVTVERLIGNPARQQTANAVARTAVGGLVIAGHDSDIGGPRLWRLSPAADLTHTWAIDGFYGAGISHLLPMSDGGWLLGGHNYAGFERAGELVRLGADGSERWRHVMGSERYTNITALTAGADGSLTVVGTYWDKQSTSAGWVMHLDERCR